MNSTERFPVEGGKTYRFSYKIKSVNCDMASAVVKATVYNDKNAAVAERQSGETILNRGSEPSGWTEIYVTRTLPSDAVSASVSITVTKGAAEFWLDDVTVRGRKSFLRRFFPRLRTRGRRRLDEGRRRNFPRRLSGARRGRVRDRAGGIRIPPAFTN